MAFDLFAGTDDPFSFDHVAEFADIARPGMKLKRFEPRVAQKTCRTSVLLGRMCDQVLCEQWQVFFRSRSRGS